MTSDKSLAPVPCDQCRGTGYVRQTSRLLRLIGVKTAVCDKCDGAGWLDDED